MKKIKNPNEAARLRRKRHIRQKIAGTPERPRLVVFRSARHIYAQLIDDVNQKTLTGVSSLTKDLQAEIKKAGNKIDAARIVGKGIAKKAKAMKLEEVVFDRNGYIYHGRIKAVADGAREGGLKF
ncbi:50S ribosomal protein L18 [candidate division KSB1 bacterium 4484_87]|nr:MAG: 50S ribosomal protein L18 [candidate division KSB1 bacterium 4484_87]